MSGSFNLEIEEHPSITALFEQWAALCPTPPELSHEEKLDLTTRVSELSGRDLLSEGVLLTGVISANHNSESSPAVVDVTFSYQFLDREKPMSFEQELEQLINKYSQENASNTPDFVLAKYLKNCLGAFNEAVQDRELWYGRKPQPASADPVEQLGPNTNTHTSSDEME